MAAVAAVGETVHEGTNRALLADLLCAAAAARCVAACAQCTAGESGH